MPTAGKNEKSRTAEHRCSQDGATLIAGEMKHVFCGGVIGIFDESIFLPTASQTLTRPLPQPLKDIVSRQLKQKLNYKRTCGTAVL